LPNYSRHGHSADRYASRVANGFGIASCFSITSRFGFA
jgi:hypothetical protein